MQTIFVHQRINFFGFLKREKRGFGRRNQTDFAPAIFAPSADKMPFVLENINFAGLNDDFRAYFSHIFCLKFRFAEQKCYLLMKQAKCFSVAVCLWFPHSLKLLASSKTILDKSVKRSLERFLKFS